MEVNIVSHETLDSADSWDRGWLESRELFDAYRRELPQRGEQVGHNLYVYDRKPEGFSRCVFAWIDQRRLLVGYPPFYDLHQHPNPDSIPSSYDTDELNLGCLVLLDLLEQYNGQRLLTHVNLTSENKDTFIFSCNYAATLTQDDNVSVAWGVRGDWCGTGLIDWWNIDYEFDYSDLEE